MGLFRLNSRPERQPIFAQVSKSSNSLIIFHYGAKKEQEEGKEGRSRAFGC